MEDKLIELLESFGYPVIRQGSLGEDESYPATFFTFWNRRTDAESFYDNKMFSSVHWFDVNVYSEDVDLAYSLLREARNLLTANGFTIYRVEYDIASDEESHIGRGMQVQYLKGDFENG